MNLYQPTITGSLAVSGSVIVDGSITANTISGTLSGTASLATTASYAVTATSASYAVNASNALSASNASAAATASYVLNAVSASYANNASAAANSTLFNSTASTVFATTGSNTLTGVQYISNTNDAIAFSNTTASIYTDGGLQVTKNAYFSSSMFIKDNLTVFGTQSVSFITSSQLNIGTNLITVNTDTPSVRFGGLAVQDSGSTGLTGSILWDSQDNQWIYTNPSGSEYDSAMFLVGPRNSGTLGNEVGITTNALAKGNGAHHMTSSGIFEVSGSVGIGTSSPTTALHISGTTGGLFEVDGAAAINALFVSASGRVGIGTTNPLYKLHVEDDSARVHIRATGSGGDAGIFMKASSSFVGGWTVKDDGNRNFWIYSDYANITRLYINSIGSIGINGVIPTSAWGSNTKAIQIGSGSLYNDGFNNTLIATNAYFNGSDNAHLSTGPALRYFQEITNGEHYFQVAPSKAAGSSVAYTSSLYIKNNGNIGVNTVSPLVKLHVVGGSEVGIRSIVGGTYSPIQFSGDNNITSGSINAYNGIIAIGRTTNDGTGVNPDIAINSSGNIGIGITSPSRKLHILSTNDTRGILIHNSLTTSYAEAHFSASREYRIGTGGSGAASEAVNNWYVYDNTAATQRFVIDSSGNVGVGVTNPSVTFNVSHPSHGIGIAYRGSSALPSIAGLFTDTGVSGGTGYGDLLVKARTDYGGFYGVNFYTAASDNVPVLRVRVQSDGVLSLLSGQLKFPATQNPSSDVNTLDDYEEGTVNVATLTDGVATFTQHTGNQILCYTKIGNRVFVSGNIYNSGISGTWTNPLRIPLPFTAASSDGRSRSTSHAALYNWGTSDNIFKIENGGATYAELVSAGSGGAWGTITTSAGFTVIVNFSYITNV